MQHGEQGDKFYVIIKGIVSVSVPNGKIKNWRIRRVAHVQDQKWYVSMVEKYIDLKKTL